MKNLNKDIFNKKMVAAITLGLMLGISIPYSCEAETIDMINRSDDYVISGTQSIGSTSNPWVFQFGFDKNTGEIVGKDIVIPKTYKNMIYANLVIKKSDLASMTATEMAAAFNKLVDKYKVPAGGALNNIRYINNIRVTIVDDEGGVIRKGTIIFDSNENKAVFKALTDAVFKQTLVNDGTADEYDIKDNTISWLTYGSVVIRPDFTNSVSTTKAGVLGADNDVKFTNLNNGASYVTSLLIDVNSNDADEKVYGVYNDKKGSVTLESNTIDIEAKGEAAKGIFAANDADYKSVINLNIPWSQKNYIKSTNNAIEAGKNGEVNINYPYTGVIDVESEKGYLFYAHDNGKINLNNLTLSVKGNGLLPAAYATKGGSINLGLNENYLEELDYNYITVANTNVDFSGDLITDETGIVKMGIGGTGIFTGNIVGNVSVYADNGATWNGTVQGDTASLRLNSGSLWNVTENSNTDLKLKTLTGSDSIVRRGYVNMTDSNVNIAKYSGNTTFTYKHSDTDPAIIMGGNVVINSAEPLKLISLGIGDATQKAQASEMNSTVTLATSSAGIDTTNKETINKVLNNLAEKLFYLGYTKGERNLTGTVEIAEGLTSTSVSKYYSDIIFDEKTGQATKDVSTYNPYTSMISGNTTGDADYAAVFDKDNMSYKFDKDTYINNKVTGAGSAMGSYYYGAINNYGDKPFNTSPAASANGPSYTVDMQGHNLGIEINAFPAAGSTGNQPMWTTAGILACREGTITIENPGAISIQASANYYYGSAIRASTAAGTDTGAHVVINNDNSKDHVVTIRGGIPTSGYEMNYRALEAFTQTGSNAGNTITIKGLADIETNYAACIFARNNGSKISVGGGRIYANKYDAIWTTGTGRVDVNVMEDAQGNVTGAGANDVIINGNVSTQTEFYGQCGNINLGLTTGQSNFTGQMYGPEDSQLNMWLQNGAVWDNKALVFHPWSGSEMAVDKVSNLTNLYGGADNRHAGAIYQESSKDIKIGNMYGYANAYIGHAATDASNFDSYGNIIIDKAYKTDGKNASLTLYTNRDGVDTTNQTQIVSVLSNLAKKLIYNEAVAGDGVAKVVTSNINLDGHVGIAEGLVANSVAMRLADLDFSNAAQTGGSGTLIDSSIRTPDEYVNILYGDTETAMMRGAKSAMASSVLAWRSENSDFTSRLGDLRKSADEDGIWANIYASKSEYNKDKAKYEGDFKTYQIGYDRPVGNSKWHVGGAFSYMDGNSTYETGNGENNSYSIALYGSYLGTANDYLDIVLKGSRLKNQYKVFNDSGVKLDGDYENTGFSLSTEYGKRFTNAGFFIEPQVQLTYSRLNSKDYDAHSDYDGGKDLSVSQDAMNSLIGRIGLGIGKDFKKGSAYLKASVLHEFSGDISTTFAANNEPTKSTKQDFGDTWTELSIGGTAKINSDSYIYLDLSKTFGGDIATKWKANVGMRWAF